VVDAELALRSYGRAVPLRLRAAVFAADDPTAAAAFWAALLGRRVVGDAHGALVAGDERQLGLRFVAGRVLPAHRTRMHLHVTSDGDGDQEATVARALRLGARQVDVGQLPEEEHVVLADVAGTAFCVIEPGNAYLAGCGPLGELTCDGSRDVGVFWSAALGWPLVWDQDEETAVQSPRGGTKVAWGGPPLLPVDPQEVQHLELVVDSGPLEAEVARLLALGATRGSGGSDGVVVLADPDGVAFRVLAG
jgi:catechol 2,3-dioxygenase-like lactoylglutathione lyase family enzyme